MLPIARYLREYVKPGSFPVEAIEAQYQRGDESLACTIYRLPERKPRPGWVLLHGLTAVGRRHPSMERFSRALAASGAVVLSPDIPEWRDLHVAPALTLPTIREAVRELAHRPDADPARIGLIGFSFGATQALTAVVDPSLDGICRGVAAWGGYRDLHRTFRFLITGEHELDGSTHYEEPDPYGGWVMAGNYLTQVPEFADCGDVAGALHDLAREAGQRRIYAWDPVYDPSKRRLRELLPPEHRALFDLFAPPTGERRTGTDWAREVATRIADAALRVDPLLDPGPFLPALRVRTVLAHGRTDRLVPFTETIRLAREIPGPLLAGATITSLLAHSGRTQQGLGFRLPSEAVRFIKMLDGIVRFV